MKLLTHPIILCVNATINACPNLNDSQATIG